MRAIRSVGAAGSGDTSGCGRVAVSVPGAVARLRDVTALTKLLTSGNRAARSLSSARSIAATTAGGTSFATCASGGVGE